MLLSIFCQRWKYVLNDIFSLFIADKSMLYTMAIQSLLQARNKLQLPTCGIFKFHILLLNIFLSGQLQNKDLVYDAYVIAS